MTAICSKIWQMLNYLMSPSRRRTRVKFTPSTLHREIIRSTKLQASRNPFFNFLSEVRLKALNRGDTFRTKLTPRECARAAQAAGRLWREMSDEEKEPYRNIALKQPKLKRLRRHRRHRHRSSLRKEARKPETQRKVIELGIAI